MKIINPKAWAICHPTQTGSSWRIRKIVWGRLLARAEKRRGESIMQVRIEPEPTVPWVAAVDADVWEPAA